MSLLVGLTGSIGMGKSTTAKMFAEHGIPVWDADAAVHRIYGKGGAAVAPLQAAFPHAIVDGAVSRDRLKRIISEDPKALVQIEAIVHPLVAEDRLNFTSEHSGSEMLLFDIPLLFETGADAWLDATICVTAPADVQRVRVLSRPGMTEEQFQTILSRQMPDAEKRARADYVIETLTLDAARAQVAEVIEELKKHHA